MMCPYIRNFTYIVQKNVLNGENPDFVDKHSILEVYGSAKCIKEECGVWDKKEERCRYNG